MLAKRKSQSRPHTSFDVDGDGFVSQKDLFLASKFDKDQDGRLNSAEARAAKEALASGFEQQF